MTTPKVRAAWPIGFTPADLQRAPSGERTSNAQIIATGNVIGVVDDNPGKGTWDYRIRHPSGDSGEWGPWASINVASPVAGIPYFLRPFQQDAWSSTEWRESSDPRPTYLILQSTYNNQIECRFLALVGAKWPGGETITIVRSGSTFSRTIPDAPVGSDRFWQWGQVPVVGASSEWGVEVTAVTGPAPPSAIG
ncbi:hypothetical protein [Candidatus Poriferisocius sp.]|uniref:hypothetical protein n=1 Tax=Candidatus Poriferisocius sp. TaxID=3101276 RepID=UPI003B51BF35